MQLDKDLISEIDISEQNGITAIILQAKTPNLFVKFILGFLILFFTLVTIGMLIAVLISGVFRIQTLIIPVIVGVCVYYLCRVFLWNLYGKELLNISANEVSYVADYGKFQDNQTTFLKSETKAYLIDQPVRKEGNYKLVLESGTKKIIVVTEYPKHVVNELLVLLK